jgi:hypothetical protein
MVISVVMAAVVTAAVATATATALAAPLEELFRAGCGLCEHPVGGGKITQTVIPRENGARQEILSFHADTSSTLVLMSRPRAGR